MAANQADDIYQNVAISTLLPRLSVLSSRLYLKPGFSTGYAALSLRRFFTW